MNHTSKSTEREAAGETYKCFSMPRFSAASCAHGTNMSCKMHTGGVDGTTLAQAPLLIDGTCASYKGHSTLNQYLHHGTCDGIILVVVLLHYLVVVHVSCRPEAMKLMQEFLNSEY